MVAAAPRSRGALAAWLTGLACLLGALGGCDYRRATPTATCQAISLGEKHGCAVCAGPQVQCWGSDSNGQASEPVLARPRAVAASWLGSCALDDEGAKCWGDNWRQVYATYPGAWRGLARYGDELCLLGRDEVLCRPSPGEPAWSAPDVRHPRQVAVGASQVCVLDDAGLRCWSAGEHRPSLAPEMANAREIAAGNLRACASDGATIRCRYRNDHLPAVEIQPQPAGQIRSLAMNGYDEVCALVDGALRCWDDGGRPKPGTPPWRGLQQVAAGDEQVCVLTAAGRIRCHDIARSWKPRSPSFLPGPR